MSIIEQLERHVADFESSGGSIPRVRSVGAMFAEYGDQSAQPLHVLTLELQGYMPVRLLDGTLGFLRYGTVMGTASHRRLDS